jgi:hypothetical protein
MAKANVLQVTNTSIFVGYDDKVIRQWDIFNGSRLLSSRTYSNIVYRFCVQDTIIYSAGSEYDIISRLSRTFVSIVTNVSVA